ncbi:MAG TPA: transposase, partial [Pyrinomonadaceae bacterium]
RFHLVRNVRDVLCQLMMRQNRLLRSRTLAAPPSSAPSPENDAYAGCRLRLLPHLEGKKSGRRKLTSQLRLPSAQESSWMLLRPEKLKDEEKEVVELLRRLAPEVARARELALNFVGMIRGRRPDELRRWLIDALRSEIPELVSFANGLTDDVSAVKAALEYEWSQGQVEGQVHRLKMIKRQMYGRGKLDLLRARVLYAA